MRKFLAILLAVAMITALFTVGSPVSAEESYLITKTASQAEKEYRVMLADVPFCTWTEETYIVYTTKLYDVYGEISGFIYEYKTGNQLSGFMQINVTDSGFDLDSYSFGDGHAAAKAMREKQFSSNSKSKPLVYLGGFQYVILEEDTLSGNVKVYDVIYEDEFEISAVLLRSEYQNYKLQQASSILSTEATRATTTTYVRNYSNMTMATYANTGAASNECAVLAGINCSMYWDLCRGKTGLYRSVPGTYADISEYINVTGEWGVSCQEAYSGLGYYYADYQGAAQIFRTYYYSNWSWSNMTSTIALGVPIVMATPLRYVHGNGGVQSAQGHFVTVFGHQTLSTGTKYIIVADGNTTNLITKKFDEYPAHNASQSFSFAIGWY